jgi:hypothetical protein
VRQQDDRCQDIAMTLAPLARPRGPRSKTASTTSRPKAVRDPGGTFRVEIAANKKTGKMQTKTKSDDGAPVPEFVPLLPPEFNTKSTLRYTVSEQSSQNEKDFHLKTPDKRAGP